MTALLGKITGVRALDSAEQAGHRLEISFKATCRLPSRTPAPEWLKDQVLKIERVVADPREVGVAGDAIVLSVQESTRWLTPLQVTPDVQYGCVPEQLTLTLRWWKDEKGPEYTVCAQGRQVSGNFEKVGEQFTATVPTAAFFATPPTLPVEFEVTCDKLKAACTVLPEATPFARKLLLPAGEIYRLENAWYRLDILGSKEGGGICAWRERGRDIDHFQRPEHLIQRPLDTAGHIDRYQQGWMPSGKLVTVALSCGGIRREHGLSRIYLDGMVDEGQNLRTSLTCQLYDELPLAIWQREFSYHTGKKPEGDKAKEELPKEPIDEVTPMGVGFRSAWAPERNGTSGSRLLCAYDDQLVTLRSAVINEMIWCEGWRMSSGWVVVEHPRRREYMLYLYDQEKPPLLRSWSGPYSISLEPKWLLAPARAGDSFGFTLAVSAGELCGATAGGVWVCCRAALPTGGVRCGVIARVQDSDAPTAQLTLGEETREAPLVQMLVPGVGTVYTAVAEFPSGTLTDPFTAIVAGIVSRQGSAGGAELAEVGRLS